MWSTQHRFQDTSERRSVRHMSELEQNSSGIFNQGHFDTQQRSMLNLARADPKASLDNTSDPARTSTPSIRRSIFSTPGSSLPFGSSHQLPSGPIAPFSSPGYNDNSGSSTAVVIRQKLTADCPRSGVREPKAIPVQVFYTQDPLDVDNQVQWVISGPDRFDKSYIKTLYDDNVRSTAINNPTKQRLMGGEDEQKRNELVSQQHELQAKRRRIKEGRRKQKRLAIAQQISQFGKTFAGNGPMEYVKQKYIGFDDERFQKRTSLVMEMEAAEDTIIGGLHEPAPPMSLKAQEWLEAWKSDDPEVCCVCLEDDCSSSNSFVYCSDESCEVIVHQACYAIHKLPSKDEPWFCDRCAALREDGARLVSCALCPSTCGAFRKLKTPHHGIKWVHVVCALHIWDIKISNARDISDITVPNQESQSWKGECSICEIPLLAEYGAYQKCSEGSCTKKLHVTCAMKYLTQNGIETPFSLRCLNHHSSANLTLNLWEQWINRRDEHMKSKAGELCLKAWQAAVDRAGHKSLLECNIVFSHLVNQAVQTQTSNIMMEIKQLEATIAAFQRRISAGKFSNIARLRPDLENTRSNIAAISETRRTLERFYYDVQVETALILQRAHANFLKHSNQSQSDVPLVPVTDSPEQRSTTLPSISLASDHGDCSGGSISDRRSSTPLKNPGATSACNKPTTIRLRAIAPRPPPIVPQPPPIVSQPSPIVSWPPPIEPRPPPEADVSPVISEDGHPNPDTLTPMVEGSGRKNVRETKENLAKGRSTQRDWMAPFIDSIRRHSKKGRLKCFECGKRKVPPQTIEALGITDADIAALDEAAKTRIKCYTGAGKLWDPRVFIECVKCKNLYHCGCTHPPVTNYPTKFERFICQDCDPAENEVFAQVSTDELDNEKNLRQRQRINYKV